MFRVDSEHKAIEKASTFGGSPGEQRIHRRHQPDHTEMVGEGCGRGDRLAIDATFALDYAVAGRPLDAGAKGCESERAVDLGDGPRAVPFAESDLIESGPAQSTPWGKERDRFDQVGFAGAVRADQYDGSGVGLERRRMIVAEIRDRQAAKHPRNRSQLSLGGQSAKIGASAAIPTFEISDREDGLQTRIGIST